MYAVRVIPSPPRRLCRIDCKSTRCHHLVFDRLVRGFRRVLSNSFGHPFRNESCLCAVLEPKKLRVLCCEPDYQLVFFIMTFFQIAQLVRLLFHFFTPNRTVSQYCRDSSTVLSLSYPLPSSLGHSDARRSRIPFSCVFL